jgi:hypothetical protein
VWDALREKLCCGPTPGENDHVTSKSRTTITNGGSSRFALAIANSKFTVACVNRDVRGTMPTGGSGI